MPLRSRTITFLLICLPYYLNLDVSALWDANESLYAETAREMLESGDLLHPTFNYEPRTQKPPLTYWVITGSYAALGVSEFSTRLPSALAVTALFLFVFVVLRVAVSGQGAAPRWQCGAGAHVGPPLRDWSAPAVLSDVQPSTGSTNSFGTETALLATAILATTPRFFIVARRLPIDCLFTVCLTISLLFVMWGCCRGRDSADASTGHWIWLAGGCFAGLAVLTKGPVAIVIEATVLSLFAFAERRWLWKSYLIWAIALALVSFPYYAVLLARGETGGVWSFLVKENLGRYTSVVFGPERSFLYYFGVLLTDAFPWSWFLPALLFSWRRAGRSSGSSLFAGDPIKRFCALWFVAIFALFSFSRNKQEYYILPAYPAMAILLASYFQTASSRVSQSAFRISARVLAVMLLFPAGAAIWLALVFHTGPVSWLIAALLLASAVILWSRPFPPSRAAGTLAMFLLLVMVDVCVTFLPAVEKLRPAKKLTLHISQQLGPEDRAGYFRYTSPGMAFYLRRAVLELYEETDLREAARQPGRLFLLMEASAYQHLPPDIKPRFEVLASAARLPTRARDFLHFARSRQLPQLLAVAEKE